MGCIGSKILRWTRKRRYNAIDDKDHGLGAKLFLKEGYINLDGSEFDFDKFERLCAGLNHRMHGIYDKQD